MRFEIICGTSVGAINCCYLAASNHMPEVQGRQLVEIWSRLRIDGIYHVGLKELLNLPKFLFGSKGRGEIDESVGPGRLGGFFNTSPLEQLVKRGMRWQTISSNIASGDLKALAVNATHVASGKTHVFIQRASTDPLNFSTDPQIEAHETEIGPQHALASAAIPWVFPAVEINGQVYVDGGLKLNTPISPALRLGADRLFVIGLRSKAETQVRPSASMDQFPSAAFLFGKILNAFMLDKTDYDLKRLQRFNSLLKGGTKAFGDDFLRVMNDTMTDLRGSTYREIETLSLSPSENISEIATKHIRSGTIASRAGGLVGPFLRRISDSSDEQASDLLSYLLFDGEFSNDLIRLGMHDADAERKRIIEFFSE